MARDFTGVAPEFETELQPVGMAGIDARRPGGNLKISDGDPNGVDIRSRRSEVRQPFEIAIAEGRVAVRVGGI